MSRHRLIQLALATALTTAHALAQFTAISTPNATYTSGTTLVPITAPNSTSVSSVSNGGFTVTFSSGLTAATVPGGGWATWGSPPNTESATPRVAFTGASSLTLSFSAPVGTFGVEIEPNNGGAFSISATFMNGATSLGVITRSITGSSGALLAAATSVPSITSVVITAPPGAGGFAIAQLRFQLPVVTAVPAVGTTGIFGLGLALLAGGALLARKQMTFPAPF